MTQPTERSAELFDQLDLKLVKMPQGVRLVVIEDDAVLDITETDDHDPKSVRRLLNEILRLAHDKGFTTEKLAVRLKG